MQLSDSDKISMTVDGDNYSLTISNAQSSDSGEYKITASSSGGHLSCTASLLVTGTIPLYLFHELVERRFIILRNEDFPKVLKKYSTTKILFIGPRPT